MTAQQFADNAFLQNANARMLALFEVLQRVPQSFWRKLIIVIALFWISHSLANLFWVLYPVSSLPQPTTIAQPLQEEGPAGAATVDLSIVQSINLSGVSSEVAAANTAAQSAPNPDVVQETSLSLKLQGIIASNDDTKGKAIIADNNTQALYQVGETLPQGRNVKLAQVLADRVILDNNGNFEALFLYSEEDFKGLGGVRASSVSVAPPPLSRNAARVNRGPDSPGGKSDYQGPGVRSRVNPEQLKAKSINDVVRFSLQQENGEVVGYRIRPGRDRGLFDQLGLKNNDIVTAVNGVVINDRNQLREIYKTMRSATEANLEVNRGGQIIPITITLDTGG